MSTRSEIVVAGSLRQGVASLVSEGAKVHSIRHRRVTPTNISERGQRQFRVRRVPPDGFAKIGGNDARRIVTAQPGDVASGMRRAAAQIEARNQCAIAAGAVE